jgi:hypothetical protein
MIVVRFVSLEGNEEEWNCLPCKQRYSSRLGCEAFYDCEVTRNKTSQIPAHLFSQKKRLVCTRYLDRLLAEHRVPKNVT